MNGHSVGVENGLSAGQTLCIVRSAVGAIATVATTITTTKAVHIMSKQYRTLRLILGDQLNASHSWYRQHDDSCLYVIAELKQETDYVRHHWQKICAFFAAMQNFAKALQASGHKVLHLTLDDTSKHADLPALIESLIAQYKVDQFEYQRPDEYRLLHQLRDFSAVQPMLTQEVCSEHFLLPYEEIKKQFQANKAHRMEMFYRRMRKRFNYLMDDGQPIGERWNFDSENRAKLKARDLDEVPEPLLFSSDVSAINERLKRHNVDGFGDSPDAIIWPINRSQSRDMLADFCQRLLPQFGRFQDAMTGQHNQHWSLYHSRLSFAMNAKILHPQQVIEAAIQAWQESPERIELAQVEGFVRQILGWREFVRGIYWANMPDYARANTLQAEQALPHYFWSAKTSMRCMSQAIGQSLEYAYAHHIQRLMVIGNFSLLAGIHPDHVDQWYLGVYIDAIEWVELPNTRGMSQFADGGLLASKPYAGSGQYINRMSDYCKGCHYKVRERTGKKSCPFNSLYWHFVQRHRQHFKHNPRMAMVYRNWDKQDHNTQQQILQQGQYYLDNIEHL